MPRTVPLAEPAPQSLPQRLPRCPLCTPPVERVANRRLTGIWAQFGEGRVNLTDIGHAENLVSLFLQSAGERAERPFLTARIGGEWTPLSWREVARQVCLIAERLRAMGLAPGDRVMIVSENRPEWCIADLAIMAAGLVTVPAYTTNTEADHRHILGDSGARAVFVSTAKLAAPLLRAMEDTGEITHVIAIEPMEAEGAFTLHRWHDLAVGDGEPGDEGALAEVSARAEAVGRADLACIIYTSGTGGAPRGVMLHHGAILANVLGAAEALERDFDRGDERFLSFLPLSHALEHTAGMMLPIALGAEIWFAEGLDKLSSNLVEARPTLMIVVPRLFEVLRSRIMKQVEKQGRVPRMLLALAQRIGESRLDGRRRLRDWPADLLLERTLRPKIAERFGGRIKALVSGGAPLNPEVGAFFQGMGLTMLQGYGQTEAAPVISCNFPSAGIRLRTVGPPLGSAEVRIAEDGEILVRGALVMTGYWRNPEETAKAIRDGWLHTGDIGHFDDGGRLMITDRKKDIIVNDKGDNIAPQKLEGMLALQPELAQVMVSGDRRPYVVALIVPDAEWAQGWAKARGVSADLADLQQSREFIAAIREAVERTNAHLSVTEKIRKFALADEPFSVENRELTPTLKLRRAPILARYGDRLDALY